MSKQTAAAWSRIAGFYFGKLEEAPVSRGWFGNLIPSVGDSPSLLDLAQREYREHRITEPERDEMRQEVTALLGPNDTYACGLWAGSTGPYGELEHSIMAMTALFLSFNVLGEEPC